MIEYKTESNRIVAIDSETQEKIGEIDFPAVDENSVVMNHTYVDSRYRGQKIAEMLFQLAIEHLSAQSLKIVPTCSYIVTQFKRHPELAHHLK